MSLRALGWGLSSLLSLLVTTAAQAQQAGGPERTPDGRVRVVISNVPPSVKLRVVDRENEQTVAECWGRCVFWTEPGRYTVSTRDLQTDTRRQLGLAIRRPGRFQFDEGDDSARNVGLVVGIVGPAAILTGMVLLLPALTSSSSPDSSSSSDRSDGIQPGHVGIGLIILGAVATPIGWSTFASNRARLLPVGGAPERAATAPSLAVALTGVGLEGLGLAGVAHF